MKKFLLSALIGIFLIPCLFARNATTSDFIEIKTETQFNSVIKAGGLVMVDFYATWCGPCKMMPPVLKQLQKESKKPIAIAKVDVDKNESIATAYKISAIPTLILFKDGKLVWSTVGAIGIDELKEAIKDF